jgi:flagellar hook protein FlgE
MRLASCFGKALLDEAKTAGGEFMGFSSMYVAATGMLALGTGMQTISNNLANINTVGYKTMRTNYEDLISESFFAGGGVNQLGRGAKVSTLQTIFTQGAFMNSEQDTDLAIAGEGFFSVKKYPGKTYNTNTGVETTDYAAAYGQGELYYTRAGVYTFDKNGYLEDPSGNILQGWQMSIPRPGQPAVRIGDPADIRITALEIPPLPTGIIRQVTNLNADAKSVYEYPAYGPAAFYAAEEASSAA